ncbi:hypothetical protein SLEP1_g10910 [Rubroshorea leprosula]|uniref:Uncharacterized protein n=1 Tax=Rubroshorea leprosula TaxID=152421 RepID=A0AAV5IE37_9ROSI|nr:hypothetical protein SLEP1_g10910 [Rubroshorea leprosula]
MTYRGNVYFVSIPVSVFCEYICWHAEAKSRTGKPWKVTISFFLVSRPVSGAKPRLIRTRPASRTWKWWVNLPAGAAAYTKSRTRDLLKLKQAAYHLIQPLVGV